MKKTKDDIGMTLNTLIIIIVILLIIVIVAVIEMNKGIFNHSNKYITELKNASVNGQKIENKFIEEYKEYL